jgi:hypothetical protein
MQERITSAQYLKLVTEHGEQEALISKCEVHYAEHPELRLLFAIPNGGLRDKRTAAKLKAEGVRAGVPDLFLPYPASGYHGLFIEMKRPDGRTSIEQDAWIQVLNLNGYLAVVCKGQDEAWNCLMGYLGALQG